MSVWPIMGRPARLASAIWSRRRRQPSGARSFCRMVIAIGRRLRSTTRRSMANSSSSSLKSEITCSQPALTVPMAAAIAVSSSSAAVSVGIGRPSSVLWLSVREVEKPKAPARTPAAASCRHGGIIFRRRGLALHAALTHDEDPHRRVRHLRRDVEVVGPGIERVHELLEALPGPRQPFVEHCAGDVLDALHELHQRLPLVGPAGREADAAVADHRRGDAVPRRRRDPAAPGGLRVVMGVGVDEARRHDHAARVDLLVAGAEIGADRRHQAAGDRDVRLAGLAARAVHDCAAADHQRVWPAHRRPPVERPESRPLEGNPAWPQGLRSAVFRGDAPAVEEAPHAALGDPQTVLVFQMGGDLRQCHVRGLFDRRKHHLGRRDTPPSITAVTTRRRRSLGRGRVMQAGLFHQPAS